jgi:glutathione S-transferase
MSIAKLHYSPGSCAMAPHIALAEADVEYELIRVDLKGGECPSSGNLRLIRHFEKGGSGSSGVRV